MKTKWSLLTALCCSLAFCLTPAKSVADIPGLQQQIPAAEYAALVDFYASTHGEGWANNAGWMDPDAPFWDGVHVFGFEYDAGTGEVLNVGDVVYFWLPGNQLSGNIPDSLGNLSGLRWLDLSSNQLSGSIPEVFENLAGLGVLDLSGNRLSGNIPDTLNTAQLWLEWVDLGNNQLSGNIPDSLADRGHLRWLYLNNNELSGSIPESLVRLPLEMLDLSNNQLSSSPQKPPSEWAVALALRQTWPDFLANCTESRILKKFLASKIVPKRCPFFQLLDLDKAA